MGQEEELAIRWTVHVDANHKFKISAGSAIATLLHYCYATPLRAVIYIWLWYLDILHIIREKEESKDRSKRERKEHRCLIYDSNDRLCKRNDQN